MHLKKLSWTILFSALFINCNAGVDELLENGDFELGTAARDRSSSFHCKYWRRVIEKEKIYNSWLTDGTLARNRIGNNNKALNFRWQATSVFQYFNAVENEEYSFSIDYFIPSNESRWQPRIQVEWYNSSGVLIGDLITIAEVDSPSSAAQQWCKLDGKATAPSNTAYARILLNVNDRGTGPYFQQVYIDNASVIGEHGSHNLPVSFNCYPYNLLTLSSIDESVLYKDTLTKFADDKNNDILTFTKISGPDWLKISTDGVIEGTPHFADAGENHFVVSAADGRGTSDTCTVSMLVVGSLRLAHIFDDDMMLQRDASFPVWGKALPEMQVSVTMSTGESRSTSSNAQGDWALVFPAMPMSKSPVTMTISSGTRTFNLSNLLIGDVWFCSGQSNMAYSLEAISGYDEEIQSSANPGLRFVSTPTWDRSSIPVENFPERLSWEECEPSTSKYISAVGYFFGKYLVADLDIPIGLIVSARGGTRIEPWASALSDPGAAVLYNADVHPYTKLPIKGVIWYQGESNIRNGGAYTAKMQSLVEEWRDVWGENFPFYFVQLASNNYRGDDNYQLPELWAAQTRAMELIPNSGMAVITDISTIDNIHPKNKDEVGRRLALWAKHGTYGLTDLVYSGPMVKKMVKEGNKIRVFFDHVGGGLASRNNQPLDWFEIAGSDSTFVEAHAVIEDGTVLVSADLVQEPQYVRFAWNEIAEPNLMNKEGLPANSFYKQLDGQ
jgi:sialate O-acetylesterase